MEVILYFPSLAIFAGSVASPAVLDFYQDFYFELDCGR
jgi:hypothetical protein